MPTRQRYAFTDAMLDNFTVKRTATTTEITHTPCTEIIATMATGTSLAMVAEALSGHVCYREGPLAW